MTRMIDANRLLLAIRSELDEREYLRKVAIESKDEEARTLDDGYIDALKWARDQVEARAKKAAA